MAIFTPVVSVVKMVMVTLREYIKYQTCQKEKVLDKILPTCWGDRSSDQSDFDYKWFGQKWVSYDNLR